MNNNFDSDYEDDYEHELILVDAAADVFADQHVFWNDVFVFPGLE